MFHVDNEHATAEKVIRRRFDDTEDIFIFPFCDLHVGDPHSMLTLGRQFVKYIKERPNCYLMFLGDNMNNATKSSVSNVYREAMNPHEQKKFIIDMLEPVADRFLCFVPGNHELRSAKESDAELVWDLADRLGRPDLFRQNIAFLDLSVGYDAHANSQLHYKISGLHGVGGGKMPGSMLNNLINFGYSIEGLDIVICGHSHQPVTAWPGRLSFPARGDRMLQRKTQAIVAAPWQLWGGYAARFMCRPSTPGPKPLRLCGTTKEFDLDPWH